MKSILLYVDHDAALQSRLQVALDIARATNGHITCLQTLNHEVLVPGDMYGSAMAAAIPALKENAESLRAAIEADLSNEGVSWDWRFEYGPAQHRLLQASALADIILLGPDDRFSGRGPSELVGDVVLKAHIPVLIVPQRTPSFDIGAPMMVAWNGSPEACNALRAATPLLACARAVTLVSVAESGENARFDVPATDGARYLSRHGVACEIVEIPRGDAGIADTLFSAAQMRECGLMVMGAYGRSRLAELLFGGVTRRMLTEPQMPVLLAH